MAPRVRKKKKDDDEVTRLQKEIRELKSTNRALMKRLKKVDRNYEEVKEEVDQELEERYVELSDPTCKDCGRGNIIIIDLPSGKLKMCDVCKKRTKTKH